MNRLNCIASLLLICFASIANAQWQRLNGPSIFEGEVGNITCITTNDSFVWAGTAKSGLFRYDNINPSQWEAINGGVQSFTIFSINYNNGSLITTTDKGIYRSTNNGNNWSTINDGLPLSRKITSFTIANGIYIAATSNLGIFRSTNNGQNWQQANNGLLDNNILQVKADGNSVWALSRNAGLFKSTDGGQSWTAITVKNNCLKCTEIAILDSTILIAQESLLVSTNSGKTWQEDNSVQDVKSITAYKGRLIANTNYRLYESLDTGEKWFLEPEFNLDSSITINTALSTPNEVKYVATASKGLARGQIAAVTWKPFNIGLLTANITQIETDKGLVYASAFGGLYRSADNGDNWLEMVDLFNVKVNSFVVSNDKLIVATDTSGIRVATTDFFVFKEANSGLGSKKVHKVIQRGNTIYALTDNGIYRTPNQGDNWFKFADLIDTLQYTDLLFDGNILYAGTESGLYKSTNGGNSFELVDSTNLPRYYVHFIRKVNGQLWMMLNVFTHVSDDGITWPRHFYDGGFTFANEVSFVANKMYASTNNGYLFKDTTKTAWNFMPRIEGLQTNNFAVNTTYLFAGTSAGIWRLPQSDIIASTATANKQSVLNIYPNPATNSIIISNEVEQVTIYSLEGKQLITCTHCQTLNISNFAAGIYIVKAITGEGVLTQKLVKE